MKFSKVGRFALCGLVFLSWVSAAPAEEERR
jgi:hypothetical protein